MVVVVTRTVEYVNPVPREWQADDGKKMWFVEANFEDGESGSCIAFSEAKATETYEALKAIVGQAVDFTLDKGKEYNGKQQWKIKGFPGKPEGGGGGGGSRSGGGMSHAQAGYMAAASALAPQLAASDGLPLPVQAAMIVELGELLTEALFSRRKTEGESTGSGADQVSVSPSAPSPQHDQGGTGGGQIAANAITLAQMKRLKDLGAEQQLDRLGITRLGELDKEQAEAAIALLEV